MHDAHTLNKSHKTECQFEFMVYVNVSEIIGFGVNEIISEKFSP